MTPPPASPLPGWTYTEGIGYTRMVGRLKLEAYRSGFAHAAHFWSVRLNGFLVASCWNRDNPTTANAHAAMAAAEREARTFAGEITADLG